MSRILQGTVQLKPDGIRWRTGGEVKGKLANGVGSQYPSHRFTLPRNLVYPPLLPLMRPTRLPVVDWTDVPAHLNGLVLFAERPNLVSARVPSHFKRSLLHTLTGDRYSDWLRAGRSVDRILVGTRFSAPVQTDPGAHPPHLVPRLKKE